MRISKIQIFALLCICMMSSSLSKVTIKKQFAPGALRKGDVLSVNMNEYFDFSQVTDLKSLRYTVTQSAKPNGADPVPAGNVYQGIDQPFFSIDYPKTVLKDNIAFSKYLDERSFIFITEYGEVVYEETTANGMPLHFENP